MRKVADRVAMRVDDYIAGPKGGYGWIAGDPSLNLAAHYSGYETADQAKDV